MDFYKSIAVRLTLLIDRYETDVHRFKFSLIYYEQKITHFAIDRAFYKSRTYSQMIIVVYKLYLPTVKINHCTSFSSRIQQKQSVIDTISGLFTFQTCGNTSAPPDSTRPLIFQFTSCLVSITYNTTNIYNLNTHCKYLLN